MAAPISEKVFKIATRKAVDETSLLTEEDLAKPNLVEKEDCTTKRRACKNCVCGRAEIEKQMIAEGKLLDDDVSAGPPAGGCGNCAKGDAFRCAGCPYLGKPAWNVADGGVVTVNLTDDF